MTETSTKTFRHIRRNRKKVAASTPIVSTSDSSFVETKGLILEKKIRQFFLNALQTTPIDGAVIDRAVHTKQRNLWIFWVELSNLHYTLPLVDRPPNSLAWVPLEIDQLLSQSILMQLPTEKAKIETVETASIRPNWIKTADGAIVFNLEVYASLEDYYN